MIPPRMYNEFMAASYRRVQSSMKAQVRSKKASVKATNNTSIIEDLLAVCAPKINNATPRAPTGQIKKPQRPGAATSRFRKGKNKARNVLNPCESARL
jgi:hypothetical protein